MSPVHPRTATLIDPDLPEVAHLLGDDPPAPLLSNVWGYDFDSGSNVVDVYVGYLRKKLGKDKIETVRGMGYRLTSG